MGKKPEENIANKESCSPSLEKKMRRSEDSNVRQTLKRYKNLFHVAQLITSEIDYEILFDVIIKETSRIMEVERCSIFLLDESGKMLDAIASAGIGGLNIKVPVDKGVVGWVFQHKKPAIVNDVKNDPRFYANIDKKSGLETNSILCVPLESKKSGCIGALEIINSHHGIFGDSDCDTLIHLSTYITIALENARYFNELKEMDRAKERVINHLAHELSTPISLLNGVIKRLSKALKKYEPEKSSQIEKMGVRNIRRLFDLQVKVTDILKFGPDDEAVFLEKVIVWAVDNLEDLAARDDLEKRTILHGILNHLSSIYQTDDIKMEKIDAAGFIEDLIKEIARNRYNREVKIEHSTTPGLTLMMDKEVLRRVLLGLVKNAVENTPDEGYVKVNAYMEGDQVVISCIDHGIGISPESKSQIFGGFYHTQPTRKYATKKPFAFNAGGAGIDLLRTKILAKKMGFEIDFYSKRCEHILLGNFQCPGRISLCRHIENSTECYQSGGSTFSLKFSQKHEL